MALKALKGSLSDIGFDPCTALSYLSARARNLRANGLVLHSKIITQNRIIG